MTQPVDADSEDASDADDLLDEDLVEPDGEDPPEAESRDRFDGRSVKRYLQWSLFAVLLLVVLVATFRFYFAMSTAIDRLVTPRLRPLFQAGFNLAVLLSCGVGLSLLVDRMR